MSHYSHECIFLEGENSIEPVESPFHLQEAPPCD